MGACPSEGVWRDGGPRVAKGSYVAMALMASCQAGIACGVVETSQMWPCSCARDMRVLD